MKRGFSMIKIWILLPFNPGGDIVIVNIYIYTFVLEPV